MRWKNTTYLLIISILQGCSGFSRTEINKHKNKNFITRPIQRQDDESLFAHSTHQQRKKIIYPWNTTINRSFPLITQEFFRCNGKDSNPYLRITHQNAPYYIRDCQGLKSHSLPIRNKKEHIYLVLIEILNYLQTQINSKIIIICGHRCPKHHAYANRSLTPSASKHQVGARIEICVENFEHQPQLIIDQLCKYYKQSLAFTSLPIPTWKNKEIKMSIHPSKSSIDYDHKDFDHPYISIELLYDTSTNTTVYYNWNQAHKGIIKTDP